MNIPFFYGAETGYIGKYDADKKECNNKHDLHTYKEIVAFTEGKRLDEIAKIEEGAKRPYQNVLKLVFGAVIGAVIAALGIWILG